MLKIFARAIGAAASLALVMGLGVAGSAMAASTVHQSATTPAPSWTSNAVVYEVNVRDYSEAGTLNAVTDDLPRLQALGVNILWLMPIYPVGQLNAKGSMGSPYAVRDYKGINPDMGNAADLHALISAAHADGMHVVLDWVANHSAWDNAWITEHKDWYTQDSNGNVLPPNNDWTDVADLNYDNAGLRSAMIDAMKYWVTDFDVDGFRCDYAAGVPTDFWNDATAQLRAAKSSLWFLAEDQGESDKLTAAFDSDYGWSFKDTLYKLGNGSEYAFDFVNEVSSLGYDYSRKGTFPMLFITNHDENSWTGSLTSLYGTGAKTMAVLSFTALGIPLIYNGQEVDSDRRLQFFEKDVVDWNFDSTRSKTAVAFYTKLIKLKHKNSALNAGLNRLSFKALEASSIWTTAYRRSNGTNKVYVVANLSAKSHTTTVKWGSDKAYYYRYSDGKRMKLPTSAKYSLKPWQFEIFSTVRP